MSFDTFAGLKVVSSPFVKKQRRYMFDPEHKVPVSDEMRASMERWAENFFEPYEVAYVLNTNALRLDWRPEDPPRFDMAVMSPAMLGALNSVLRMNEGNDNG